MARQDRFEVGDMVTMIDRDDYTSDAIQQTFWRRHGREPQRIEEVEDLESWRFDNPSQPPAHPQYVTVNGTTYSGFWFKPVR